MPMSRRMPAILLLLPLCVLLISPAGLGTDSATAKETGPARPERVVLVILGGGVRARDMLDKTLMPTVAEMAEGGRVIDEVRSEARSGSTAVARLLSGCPGALDSPGQHPQKPTLMEYVRVGKKLPAEKVWYISFEGEDQLKLAHSTHPEYGSGVAPGVASGLGAFGDPLATFLERTGRPDPLPAAAWKLLRGMRAANRGTIRRDLPDEGVPAGLPRSERMERALLEEIDRRSLLVRGPAPRDERAWRAAKTVLQIHRPVLTVIRLGEAEQAQKSEAAYRRVLAANDGGLKRIRAVVAADPEMRATTLFIVVPDLGRDAKPNAQGGLDQNDESEDHRELALVAFGPGFKAKKGRVKRVRKLVDVCPTLGILLDIPTPEAQGEAWTPYLRDK